MRIKTFGWNVLIKKTNNGSFIKNILLRRTKEKYVPQIGYTSNLNKHRKLRMYKTNNGGDLWFFKQGEQFLLYMWHQSSYSCNGQRPINIMNRLKDTEWKKLRQCKQIYGLLSGSHCLGIMIFMMKTINKRSKDFNLTTMNTYHYWIIYCVYEEF